MAALIQHGMYAVGEKQGGRVELVAGDLVLRKFAVYTDK